MYRYSNFLNLPVININFSKKYLKKNYKKKYEIIEKSF